MSVIIPSIIACGVNCFLVSYEETPCNATMMLVTKVLTVLRLFVALSAFAKIDHRA